MSVTSLGEPIAGTGNIYAWGEGQITKLWGDGAPEGWVEHLGKMERALYEAGLPVPEVREIIEVDGQLGQIYERIEGESLADGLLGEGGADPARIVRSAQIFAEVHAKIHACGNVPELPLQREFVPAVIRRSTVLPAELKVAVLKAFDELPAGDRVCHGDFHPYNVLLSPKGPIVIDWNNGHIGNPLEDVALSLLILSGVSASQPPLRSRIEQFSQSYLERYFELRPDDRTQLAAWRPIAAALRLSDDIPQIQTGLLEQIRIGLAGPG